MLLQYILHRAYSYVALKLCFSLKGAIEDDYSPYAEIHCAGGCLSVGNLCKPREAAKATSPRTLQLC